MNLLTRRTALTALACAGLTVAAAAPAPAAAPATVAIRDATAVRDNSGTYTLTWDARPGVREVDVYAATEPSGRGQLLATTSAEQAVLPGLPGDRRWYFELVPDDRGRGLPVATRDLGLPSVPNARDVGGYRTRDGQLVRWGAVVRADTLSGATESDVEKLGTLGLSQVVDFRSPAEVSGQGSDRLPGGARLSPRPIYDPDNDFFVEVNEIIGSGDPELQREALADGAAEDLMTREYRRYATDETARGHIGAVLHDLAWSPEPLLYHCTAGKDRTGWMTAVLLTALGVRHETVRSDYLLSNVYRKQVNERAMRHLEAAGVMTEPELLLPVLEVRAEYLDAGFAAMREQYGSFAAYLRHGLDIDPATWRQLRNRLLVR